MPSIWLKCVCVLINRDVFVNALSAVFETVLVLQSCGTVFQSRHGTVQLKMSSITGNLVPRFHYIHIYTY
jgi:hypothetical protein